MARFSPAIDTRISSCVWSLTCPRAATNGLAIRYPGEGNAAYVGMCELQVLAEDWEEVHGGKLDPRQTHGSAVGMVAARTGFQRPAGEWNYQQVTVIGSMIKVELNGTVILDCDLAHVREFLRGEPHPGKDRTEGHFGLMGHGDPVMFRNISVKRLD